MRTGNSRLRAAERPTRSAAFAHAPTSTSKAAATDTRRTGRTSSKQRLLDRRDRSTPPVAAGAKGVADLADYPRGGVAHLGEGDAVPHAPHGAAFPPEVRLVRHQGVDGRATGTRTRRA